MIGVIGDLVEDVVIRVSGPPARGTDTPARIERRRGGSGANVAAVAARIGCPVRFIGRVGADDLGDRLVAGLAAEGVDVRVQRAGRTGVIAVLVEPGGERTMFPDRGASAELDAIEPDALDGVAWLHLTAYSLCGEPAARAASDSAAARVRGAGGRISVDVSSVAVVEAFGPARFAEVLEQVAPDVVFANAAEARVLARTPAGVFVVKDGPRPVVVTMPDGRVVRVEVPALHSVADTTGAGDAFAAGFIAAMVQGADAEAAARSAVAVAARWLSRDQGRDDRE